MIIYMVLQKYDIFVGILNKALCFWYDGVIQCIKTNYIARRQHVDCDGRGDHCACVARDQ